MTSPAGGGGSTAAQRQGARERLVADWRRRGLTSGHALSALVRRGAAQHSGTPVRFWANERLLETSVGELHTQSLLLVAALSRLGVRAGDAIVSQLPNCPEGTVLLLAALHLGAVFVPVVHIYGAAELGFILRQTRARILAIPGRWRKIDFGERVRAIGHLPELSHIVVVGDGDVPGPCVQWQALLAETAIGMPPSRLAQADDLWLVNYTSGSTSDPKAVMLSQGALAIRILRHPPCELRPISAPTLRLGPAGHIGGVIFALRPFLVGEHLIYMDHFDAAAAVDLIRRNGAARVSGVPAAAAAMLELGDGNLPPTLKHMQLGGAGVAPSLIERLQALGVCGTRTYGCTEVPTISAGEPSDSLEKRANTDGRIVAECMVRIVADDETALPAGESGEIIAQGPQMFLGYLDRSLEKSAFAGDGWYRTGDIGVLDPQGYLTIVDRKKDIIVRGGENISSREVENLLVRHPAILEAAAVAWPDPVLGERIGAFVRLREGARVGLLDIQAHFLAAGVARQKTPEHLVVVEEMPRSATGKVLKHELRRRIVQTRAAARGKRDDASQDGG